MLRVTLNRLIDQDRRKLQQDGYCLVRRALDPETDLMAVQVAYSRLIDELAPFYLSDRPEELERFGDCTLSERIAVLNAVSGGLLFDHLDPLLRLHTRAYKRRRDLPPAQLPEVFQLIRTPKLLDLIEDVLGSEISVSPAHHANLKLPAVHLALGRRIAENRGLPVDPSRLEGFYLGRTPMHRDARFGMSDADDQIVTAWFPVTEATAKTSRLLVVPGSHRFRGREPVASELATVALDTTPGDVVLFDNRLLHASTANASPDQMRWSFNFRYLRRGASSGRPFLPGFVARSRDDPESELRDAATWCAMWEAALNHLRWWDFPATPADRVPLARARAVTRRWARRAPTHEDWLQLPPQRHWEGLARAPAAALERLALRLGWTSS